MKRQYSITIVIICSIALLAIALRSLGGLWPFRIVTDSIINPIGSSISQLGRSAHENIDVFIRANTLAKENKAQQAEITRLANQLSSMKELANENEELRNQLKFNEKLGFDLTAARVVSSEGTSLRKYITIDRGSNSGVKPGMAVVSSGVLVGVVDKVEDFSSVVFLATDPEFRLRGIGQDGRAQGIVRGQLGQGYIFDKVTQAESISTGELVITAGSGLVPKGILIGQVESIQKSDNAVFQSAQLKPLVNINNLEIVFIVTGLKQ